MKHSDLSKRDQRHLSPALADDIEFFMFKDGLLALFDYEDIKQLLEKYPVEEGDWPDDLKWFFNSSKDREIANRDEITKRVTVNPQFLNNFKTVVW